MVVLFQISLERFQFTPIQIILPVFDYFIMKILDKILLSGFITKNIAATCMLLWNIFKNISIVLFKLAEWFLTGTPEPHQKHTSYFRWYAAYKLYTMGRRKFEEDRMKCDILCVIDKCNQETVKWIQCDKENCNTWVHTYCADLSNNYTGTFICPRCEN